MPWFRAGMSGHARPVRITGHMLFTAATWDATEAEPGFESHLSPNSSSGTLRLSEWSCKGRRHLAAPRPFPPGRLIDRRILPAWSRSAPRRSRMGLLSVGSMSAWAGRLWPAGACGGLRADGRRAPGWAAAGGTGGGLGARLEPRPRPRSRPGRRGGRPGGGVHGGGAGAGPRGRRRAVRHQRRPRPLGTGVGRTLLAAAQAELTRLGYTEAVLWVLPNNARARRFYEVAGWITDGIQRTSEVLGVAVPEVRYRRRLQTYPARLDRHSSLVTPSLPVGSLEPATRSPSTNPHPNPVSSVVAARGRKSRLPHRSCHSRAISEGQSRYRADLASHLTKPQR